LGAAITVLAIGVAPAAAFAGTEAKNKIAEAQELALGAEQAGGGREVDFWKVRLAGGDRVTIDVGELQNQGYAFQLYAPGTGDATFTKLPAVDSAYTNGATSDQVTLQAPYNGTFILAVCENVGDCRQITEGHGTHPMNVYTFTMSVPEPVGQPVEAGETPASGTIAAVPTPLTVGNFEAGGGGKIDYWKVHLAGGDQVNLAVGELQNQGYAFQLYAPGTGDATFTKLPAVDSAYTNGATSDQVTLQAPYNGTFILAVCENVGDCRQTAEGHGSNPMNPYTFTAILPVPIGQSVEATETQAGGSIASASPLAVGAFEAGGGGPADYWLVPLEGGEQVKIDVGEQQNQGYNFQLYAPGTSDATFTQLPAVASASTNGALSDAIALQAPFSGLFVLAVCENVGDCRQTTEGHGSNPMLPYTFTMTPTVAGNTGPPPASSGPGHSPGQAHATVGVAPQQATVSSRGRFAVTLICAGAPCTGSFKLTLLLKRRTGSGRHRKITSTVVTIGSASFSNLTVGTHRLALTLNAAGMRLLRQHGHKLSAIGYATYTAGSSHKTVSVPVSLKGSARK
jgi:hypothetical protein